MTMEWTTMVPWIAAAAGLLALLALVGFWLARRRRDVLRDFARRHGLEYADAESGPELRGQLHGRAFHLEIDPRSSDHAVAAAQETRMTTIVRGTVPEGLQVLGAKGLAGALQRRLEGEQVDVGDEAFEHAVLVKALDPAAARAWLTDRRKRALLRLVEATDPSLAGMWGSELYVEERTLSEDLERLESRAALLRDVAAELEAEEPARARPTRS